MKTEKVDSNWLGNILLSFKPDDLDIKGQTPEEMIESASSKAFWVSTVSAIPPGPFGMATIIPELAVVTKIQINLVYSIAKYYGKEAKFNATILTLIFANEAGIQLGKAILRKKGSTIIIRALSSRMLRPILQKIATKIGVRITQKTLGRWIPVVTAPIFGAISSGMTKRIGQEALLLFKEDIEIEEPTTCPNGHEIFADAKFCPECGVAVREG